MSKSILVLDENSVIHGLIASALDVEGLTLHHEFNPGMFMERANSLMPDLILIGNSDSDPEYQIPRSLKDALEAVPVVLLASSKEALSTERLEDMRVDGVVRKPFEASDLQQQVSKHLDLVDLIGSAYEYRQSQSTLEEPINPLTNLDVLDDEVLGMLREESGAKGGFRGVVDDNILEETLQPERAFEPVDSSSGFYGDEDPAPGGYDALETLEGEFPGEMEPLSVGGEGLEELGAQDVLDEEPVEETLLEPEGFDQPLDDTLLEEAPQALDAIEVELPDDPFETPSEPDSIVVELPDDLIDMEAIDNDLGVGDVEMFETELDSEAPAPPAPEDYKESIPLSVRRMMELKPVFTLGQEDESDRGEKHDYAFEPGEEEVVAIQSELDQLDAVEMEADIIDEEIEFVSDEEAVGIEFGEDFPEPEPFDLDAEEEPENGEVPPVEKMYEPLPVEEFAPAAGEGVSDVSDDLIVDTDDAITHQELELPPLDVGEGPEEDLGAESGLAADLAGDDGPPDDFAEAAVETGELGGKKDDDAYFTDEYLGDQEIDEEQLIAIEEGEDLPEQPELSADDERELDELLAEEKDLIGLEEVEEVEWASEDDEEDEIELDQEEEDLIRASLAADREAALGESATGVAALESGDVQEAGEEALFERKFKDLDEEAPASDEDTEWPLKETESGMVVSEGSEEIITLGEPVGGDLSLEDEEISSSLLSEEADEEEEEESWKPDVPPSFVAKPHEGFPEDAVKGPFEGATAAPEEDPSPVPRHKPEEVLEDPQSLEPVIGQEFPMLDGEEEPEMFSDDSLLEEEPEMFSDDSALEDKPEMFSDDSLLEEEPEMFSDDSALEDKPEMLAEDSLLEEEPEMFSDDSLLEEEPEMFSDDSALEDTPEMFSDDSALEDKPEMLAEDSLLEEEPEMFSDDSALEDKPAEVVGEAILSEELEAVVEDEEEATASDTDMDDAFEPLAPEEPTTGEVGGEALAAMLGADSHEEAPPEYMAQEAEEDTEPDISAGESADDTDGEFDSLFADLQAEIEANPEGERLDDVLRNENIRDGVARLEFNMPEDESALSRAMGIFSLLGEEEDASAYPAALAGNGAATVPPPAAPSAPEAPAAPEVHASLGIPGDALSLLDPDIRNKLGQVLDEIISISVRKAVQEEMPKIMERLSRED